ncbi:DUF6525 family protein [Szabonella alba]|uniref:Uncharacterized protein n=1 Tax=Szabonella alba TaxID=2804194 RepID=A0A8K0Y094_9RHOB|nr:DUF6525 family protein [Szabonella alba]MBL4916592.1 hypothetical protein [Szabonella alba]
MRRNLSAPRAVWRSTDPMRAHDRLPAPLRHWAIQAALPWSATSLLRIWRRALAETGCEAAALNRLRAAEAARLARDATAVWGLAHPPARPPGQSRML